MIDSQVEAAQAVAVVGVIVDVAAISGADRIHLATAACGDAGVWYGVVPKEMGVSASVLVLLQDALLPPSERWAFMEKSKWRVRMARFKGAPSESVILPLEPAELAIWSVGQDVGEQLGITKYSKPIPAELAGKAKGNFPAFVPKTDEPNFQRTRDWQENLATGEWYASEKADGTSGTAYVLQDGELHVCSRNLELLDGDNIYWSMARKYGLQKLPRGTALQFEIVGPGIQGNPMGLVEHEIRAFTLYDIVTQRKAHYLTLVDLCLDLNVPTAKLIQLCSTGCNGARTPEQLRKMAEIVYPNGRPGEGIVLRALDGSWSMKCINLLYKE